MIALAMLLLVPSVVLAAPATFAELVYLAITYMNYMSQILVVATLVVYLWGAAYMLMKKQGGGSWDEMRTFLLIGIGIIFVMVSIWGILELLSNTISSGGGDFGSETVENFCAGLDNCTE